MEVTCRSQEKQRKFPKFYSWKLNTLVLNWTLKLTRSVLWLTTGKNELLSH